MQRRKARSTQRRLQVQEEGLQRLALFKDSITAPCTAVPLTCSLTAATTATAAAAAYCFAAPIVQPAGQATAVQ